MFYVATFEEAVYVLHAFEKRTPKTAINDIQLARIVIAPSLRSELMMPGKSKLKVTPSTGNVFKDLGFSAEESEHLLVRADLLLQLQKALTARGLTQARSAKLFCTSPNLRVSDLLRGRLDLFSTDTLIDMLARLGVRVRLSLSRRAVALREGQRFRVCVARREKSQCRNDRRSIDFQSRQISAAAAARRGGICWAQCPCDETGRRKSSRSRYRGPHSVHRVASIWAKPAVFRQMSGGPAP